MIEQIAQKVHGRRPRRRAPRRSSSIATRRRTCSAGSPIAFAPASIPSAIVTYIIDRNVNYTNVCVARCNFCAFYRPVGSTRRLRARLRRDLPEDRRDDRARRQQLLLQGGHNPDLPIEWYEDLFRAVKARYPEFKLHALSPPDDSHLAAEPAAAPTVIDRLVAAGLDSMPGGGAEILVDRVRKR